MKYWDEIGSKRNGQDFPPPPTNTPPEIHPLPYETPVGVSCARVGMSARGFVCVCVCVCVSRIRAQQLKKHAHIPLQRAENV